MAESYLAVSSAAFKHHPHVDITHPDFGAVSGADCTAALNSAAAAAVANGSRRVFVPGGTYYTTGWAIPHNVAVYGAAQRASNIRALEAGQPYVIRFGSNTELHDLNVRGDMLANTCVLSETGLTGKARFVRVRVAEGAEGGFIFDQHQNAKLYDCYAHYCGIGYGFINGAANIQLFGCDSDGETGISSHGAFAGNIFTNPAWSTKDVFNGGGRNIRWFGGILERGAADAQLKVTRGNITLFGVEIQGGQEATVIADGTDGGWAHVSLNDCSHAIQSSTAAAAIARNQGRIYVQGEGGHNSGGPSTVGKQYVSQGGYVSGDGGRPMQSGQPIGSRFESSASGFKPSGGGLVSFDDSKNESVISSDKTHAGGYLYWGVSPGPDNKRLLVVKLYISAIAGGNARIYTTLPGSPWRRVQKQALSPGLHEFVIPLRGDETGVQIAPDQNSATEIRVPFVDLSVR